jgi:glutamate--cysteine ligase
MSHSSLSSFASKLGKPATASVKRGIEKEALRLEESGLLSLHAHPKALGSTLTHRYITTDYSEALLEFITPVGDTAEEVLQILDDVHRFTYANIGDELLWAASMPCILPGDDNIPIARYGKSNIGQLKEVYRIGLGNRYGRLMQTIAGIHYNFSVDDDFWDALIADNGYQGDRQTFISDKYLGLIRNFRRYSWLLIYLFGASPAVCKSFLGNRQHHLTAIDHGTYGAPMGTSLRMGDLGYQSSAQENLSVCYNDLARYCDNLLGAIQQPVDTYQAIGTRDAHGQFLQLNESLLQIENEFYSTIRPKRTTAPGETPTAALRRGGIEYIEVRCIDVNPYLPLGIDATQIHFIDAFLLYCLLSDSPACDAKEYQSFNDNRRTIVNQGRDPAARLVDSTSAYRQVSVTEWAHEMLDAITEMAAELGIMDNTLTRAIYEQRCKVEDPECTPSARVISDIKRQDISYFRFAMNIAETHAAYFRDTPLGEEKTAFFQLEASESLARQRAIEEADSESFEVFWQRYYRENYGLNVVPEKR